MRLRLGRVTIGVDEGFEDGGSDPRSEMDDLLERVERDEAVETLPTQGVVLLEELDHLGHIP